MHVVPFGPSALLFSLSYVLYVLFLFFPPDQRYYRELEMEVLPARESSLSAGETLCCSLCCSSFASSFFSSRKTRQEGAKSVHKGKKEGDKGKEENNTSPADINSDDSNAGRISTIRDESPRARNSRDSLVPAAMNIWVNPITSSISPLWLGHVWLCGWD